MLIYRVAYVCVKIYLISFVVTMGRIFIFRFSVSLLFQSPNYTLFYS